MRIWNILVQRRFRISALWGRQWRKKSKQDALEPAPAGIRLFLLLLGSNKISCLSSPFSPCQSAHHISRYWFPVYFWSSDCTFWSHLKFQPWITILPPFFQGAPGQIAGEAVCCDAATGQLLLSCPPGQWSVYSPEFPGWSTVPALEAPLSPSLPMA